MKILPALITVVLVSSVSPVAGFDDSRYRPDVHGRPAGAIVGTLLDYGEGMASGAVVVRTSTGPVMLYTAASPFMIDGKPIACPSPPRPPLYRVKPDVCFRWPAYVKLGKTRVRVAYWRGTRFRKPTLITRGLTVVSNENRTSAAPSARPDE